MAKKPRRERKRREANPRPQKERTPFREVPSPYALRHRARWLAELISRFPHQIALGLADREDSVWIFGRLYVIGMLNQDQKITAERLNRVVSTYRRMLHRLDGALTSDLGNLGGGSREDLSDAAEKALIKAQAEYNAAIAALKACGPNVLKTVLHALQTNRIEGDIEAGLALIRQGLEALRDAPRELDHQMKAPNLEGAPSFS